MIFKNFFLKNITQMMLNFRHDLLNAVFHKEGKPQNLMLHHMY